MILQPTRGRITVAGEDLRSFDKSEWARAVSIVNQVTISTLVLTQIKYLKTCEYLFLFYILG